MRQTFYQDFWPQLSLCDPNVNFFQNQKLWTNIGKIEYFPPIASSGDLGDLKSRDVTSIKKFKNKYHISPSLFLCRRNGVCQMNGCC